MSEPKFGRPEDLLKKNPTAGVKKAGPVVKPAPLFGKPPPIVTPKKDGRKKLKPGEILFSQGDPGGDLFFIEEGIVEIYQGSEADQVHLADMTTGEIIGVMTCLTREPRMATAKAKTVVVCKQVPHDSIRKVLANLPNWLKIVIKEFTMRLAHMNRLYGEATAKLKKMESEQINNVYLGALISAAFANISEFMAVKFEETKLVIVDDVVQRLELVLNMPKDKLEKIFALIIDSGLIKLEIEQERKRTVCTLDNAKKLAYFAQFVRESKSGPTKKLLKVKLSNRDTRVLSGIVKYAAKLDMDLSKVSRLAVKDLEASMDRVIGVKFEREALQKGVELKLLTIEGGEDQESVVTRPSELGRTIACLEAIRRLSVFELKDRDSLESKAS